MIVKIETRTIVFSYLEPKQGWDEDEELRDLDEDRPVLDVVKDEPGGHHAQPGHQEGQPDLEQGRQPTLIWAWPANDFLLKIASFGQRRKTGQCDKIGQCCPWK